MQINTTNSEFFPWCIEENSYQQREQQLLWLRKNQRQRHQKMKGYPNYWIATRWTDTMTGFSFRRYQDAVQFLLTWG